MPSDRHTIRFRGRTGSGRAAQDHCESDVEMTMTVEVEPELVDLLIDFYCDWRRECRDVHAAYERFSGASAADRALAYAAYEAALDREQSAAEVYAEHLRRVERAASS
jgi:hypothetical protein